MNTYSGKIPGAYLARCEAWWELYRKRFGRLAPGKDDVLHDSCDEENTQQYADWHESGLAKVDAIDEVVRLTQKILDMEDALDVENALKKN